MNNFIYVNGRPDHQKGQHDDLIMAIAMAIYVGEIAFQKLERVTEQTKVMLESWTVNSNESVAREVQFNPVMSNMSANNDRYNLNKNQATKEDYIKYGWLFGGRR